jgi:hypothetical protein
LTDDGDDDPSCQMSHEEVFDVAFVGAGACFLNFHTKFQGKNKQRRRDKKKEEE